MWDDFITASNCNCANDWTCTTTYTLANSVTIPLHCSLCGAHGVGGEVAICFASLESALRCAGFAGVMVSGGGGMPQVRNDEVLPSLRVSFWQRLWEVCGPAVALVM